MKKHSTTVSSVSWPRASCYSSGDTISLLSEDWTEEELYDAQHVLSCVFEGVSVLLRFSDMERLEKRGLISELTRIPGRGRYANRYTFQWADKLESLVRAWKPSASASDGSE